MENKSKIVIFICMGTKMQSYLNRRIWREDGTYYFCRLCGDYKHENEFYNSKQTHFGKTYKCKEHYKKDEVPQDRSMDYLNLNTITDEDFKGAQLLLSNLGYTFGPESKPVWEQFNLKHNLKK